MTRPTRSIEVRDAEPRPQWIDAVRDALATGDVVILPTETVYGLAARGDRPEPLARLRELKGRLDAQAFTWHIGASEDLSELGPIPPVVSRIVARYWPGPLTLLLPASGGRAGRLEHLAQDGWIGVRCVAHHATAGILRALPFPVAMTSCNLHGEPPAVDAEHAQRPFGDRVALVLDGGPARLAESSSIARVGRGRFELVREGLIDLRQLRQAAGLRLGFVCTGNTCRSPMAEHLARAALARRLECGVADVANFGFELASMGLQASPGEPASAHAVAVLQEAGLDASDHKSRPARAEDLGAYDRLYCMTQAHLEALIELLPPKHAGSAMLLDPAGRSVPDPVGGPKELYRRAAEQIRTAIEARAPEWA
jgi:tRNA threonylcarbamoyl adenosine modification protein (Sua5/YciO/YrdC/YwlC family)